MEIYGLSLTKIEREVMKGENKIKKIPTKECIDCGWRGIEDDLVSSTGLGDDIEYTQCPSCWGEVVDIEEK